jgi:hypothetical protein
METSTIPVPTTTPDIPEVTTFQEDAGFENETALGVEIVHLWDCHVSLQRNAHATREELREIRAGLGNKLFEMKRLLASPGRGGQWSAFLRERDIARATADRLVHAHQLSLRPPNCLSDSIPETPEMAARALVRKLWPRLRAVLPTQEHFYCFVRDLSALYGESTRELRPEGVLVLRPAPEIVNSVPVIDVEAVEVTGEYGEVI